jgi:hypothetical protein
MQKTERKAMFARIIILILLILLNFSIPFIYSMDLKYILIIIFGNLLVIIVSFVLIRAYFIKNKKKEVLTLLFTLFFILLILEIFIRVTSCSAVYEWFPKEEGIRYTYLPQHNYCNKISDGFSFKIKTNSQGFIDSDFNKSNDFNIFLLGDSFAACNQANYENCLHRKLEKDLNQYYNHSIDVMNFGVGGYGALDYLGILKKYKDEYKPKLVIVYFLAQNDLTDNEAYLNYKYDKNYKIKQLIKNIFPKSISFFTKGLGAIIDKILNKDFSQSSYSIEKTKLYGVYLQNYTSEWEKLMQTELDTLLEIKKVCDKEQIPMLVVLTTSAEQVYEGDWERILETYPYLKQQEYNLSKPNTIVENFLNEQKIYNINLLESFKGNPERLHWQYDGHWNDAGQLFAEEKVKEFIIKNNLIK